MAENLEFRALEVERGIKNSKSQTSNIREIPNLKLQATLPVTRKAFPRRSCRRAGVLECGRPLPLWIWRVERTKSARGLAHSKSFALPASVLERGSPLRLWIWGVGRRKSARVRTTQEQPAL